LPKTVENKAAVNIPWTTLENSEWMPRANQMAGEAGQQTADNRQEAVDSKQEKGVSRQ
jgi:hypothetical protein